MNSISRSHDNIMLLGPDKYSGVDPRTVPRLPLLKHVIYVHQIQLSCMNYTNHNVVSSVGSLSST